MTRQSDSEIDALLGPDAPDDPLRRAELIARLSAALAEGQDLPSPDIEQLAAYLDGTLSEDERDAMYQRLSMSAEARADLQSAAELLEAIESAPERPSPALMAQAQAMLTASAVQPKPRPSLWQQLSAPRMKVGLGFAFAALIALLVWNPGSLRGPGSSRPSGSADDPLLQAVTGTNPAPTVTATTAPSSQSWGAIAVSSDGKIYGTSHGAPSFQAAKAEAITSCIARHGTSCQAAVVGQGQCFALASQPGSGVPFAEAAESLADAQSQAIAACNRARTGGQVCATVTALCSGK